MLLDVIGGTAVEGNECVVDTAINPSQTIQGVIDTADNLGCPAILVTTMAQWESLLANPPLGAIIVNPLEALCQPQHGRCRTSFVRGLHTPA